MIDRIVAQRVEAEIERLLNGVGDTAGVATTRSNYADRDGGKLTRAQIARQTYLRESGQVPESAAASADVPRRRRRRGRKPRIGYVVVPRRGRKVEPELFETARIVWEAINKHAAKNDTPISAMDLEKLTGLKKKTVESCAYYLRRHDAVGAYVKDGAGLITAEPLDPHRSK
jgi:hypothetical protein